MNEALGFRLIDNIAVNNIGHDNTVFGDKSNISQKNSRCTIIGKESKAEQNGCVIIGCDNVAKHENSIIIGNNLESANDNEIKIGDKVFIDNKFIISDNVVIYSDSDDEQKCHACNFKVVDGISWKLDKNIEAVLCFQCIYDTVLQFKTKEAWINKTGIDPISKLTEDIADLKKEIKILKKS